MNNIWDKQNFKNHHQVSPVNAMHRCAVSTIADAISISQRKILYPLYPALASRRMLRYENKVKSSIPYRIIDLGRVYHEKHALAGYLFNSQVE